MYTTVPVSPDVRAAITERIATKKPLMLSMLAEEFSITELQAAQALPEDMVTFALPEAFDEIWAELVTWDLATFIVQHLGSILEIKGRIPPGTYANGYFNIESTGGIGGHLNITDLGAIGFCVLPFMGLESLSVQFFNARGAVQFSVYAGRENRQIIPSIRESFFRCREAVCKG